MPPLDPLDEGDPLKDHISYSRVVVLLPQVYPNSPGAHVSSPQTLSVTSGIEHPGNVKIHDSIGGHV